MEMIRQNIRKYLDSIPNGIELVAVSKFHPQEAILSAYNEGQRILEKVAPTNLLTKQNHYLMTLNGISLDTCKPTKLD